VAERVRPLPGTAKVNSFEEQVGRNEQVLLPRMSQHGAVVADSLPQAGKRVSTGARRCPALQEIDELPFIHSLA
jgi:hypothetical protein